MSIKNQVEAIIFLGGDENKIKDLAKFFKISIEDMLKILLELKDDRKDTGINLEVDSEIVYLSTNPLYGEVINNYFEQETKPKKLSSASIETLSIIAYKQPVTKSEIYKKYYIKILGELKKEEIDELKKGVLLDDGKTLPAKISGIKYDKNKTSMFISIREGRNRQIRRMIEKFEYKVLMLRREKIGELALGDLPEGKYRELTKQEVEYLYSI